MLDEELIAEIQNEFLLIKSNVTDVMEYKRLVFKWVQRYYEYEEEFSTALQRLRGASFCVPNNKLNIRCPACTCSRCHLYLPKLLINRINTPYK